MKEHTCRYCGVKLQAAQKRCSECSSWLSWQAHLGHPETGLKALGLLVSVVAAAVAIDQAENARDERRAVETLRNDISAVAENVTKMAFVVADGSHGIGEFPKVHLDELKRLKEAIRPYTSPGLDSEIEKMVRNLNERTR